MENGSLTADASAVVMVVDGIPMEFEIGGRLWHLRQPTPAEMTRLGLAYDVARHRAWQDLEASHLQKSDTAAMVADGIQIGYLTAKHEIETDSDKRRDLADQIMRLRRDDKTSAWDEIASAFARAERDRTALAMLLDDDDKGALLASPGAVQEARQYVWRVLSLANTVPNWQARQE